MFPRSVSEGVFEVILEELLEIGDRHHLTD